MPSQNPPADQEKIHEILQDILVPEGEVLTTWCIAFEADNGETMYFGYWHGPSRIPPWRSLGLHQQAINYMNAETIHAELHSCEDQPPEEEE